MIQTNVIKKDFLSLVGVFAVLSFFLMTFYPLVALGDDTPAADVSTEETLTEEEQKEVEEAAKKEEEEEDIEKDLKKVEEKLEKAQEENAAAQNIYNAKYNDLSKQRYALAQTTEDVQDKEQQVTHLASQLENLVKQESLHKTTLSGVMRQIYFTSTDVAVAEILEDAPQQQFLVAQDRGDVLRQEMVNALAKIADNQTEIEGKQDEIKKAKEEKEKLLAEQKKQEQVLAGVAAQAQAVVRTTSATVSELNSKMSGLQSKLTALLGQGVSTDDIVEAADFASKKTGVRKSFILGMLIVETDLGRFTGGCTYAESRMSEYRKGIFKTLAKELGYDYKKLKVSCPPSNYRGTGGAMGVAQFMSDTWLDYQSRIARNTGNSPPDPWSLTDGVMAMALKLANDGGTTSSGEWGAAARYLGSCVGNTRFYCENVLYWADNYKKKL